MDSVETCLLFTQFRPSDSPLHIYLTLFSGSDSVKGSENTPLPAKIENNQKAMSSVCKPNSSIGGILQHMKQLNNDCLKLARSCITQSVNKSEPIVPAATSTASLHDNQEMVKPVLPNTPHSRKYFLTNFDINVLSPNSW